ncbi:hypothetical protein QF035_009103 [Streptomyces umbrinus]|uniref:Uncharacterized protein n=1 Tax=Streptomyces umbrinus TaxID=67370 RepID=A0ABU0T6X2_9ACTN|nr:hypothetical protein [Streptomyces umbrinus]
MTDLPTAAGGWTAREAVAFTLLMEFYLLMIGMGVYAVHARSAVWVGATAVAGLGATACLTTWLAFRGERLRTRPGEAGGRP